MPTNSIDTGVDKLVRLVAKEKKIGLDDAAKQLGVESAVVQEWADFLEQEGLVSLQYSLSKTFIVEKHMSAVDVEKKGKEYDNQKESFVRRVDATLHQLEQETTDFETIKKQYYTLKDQIGDEIDAVKDEVEQLRHYEELKKSIDHDVLKQKVEYQKSLEDIHAQISLEEKRYNKIVDEIKQEQESINAEQNEYADIRHEETDLKKRIDALQDLLKRIAGRSVAEEANAKLHEERLQRLREFAGSLQKDLVDKKQKEIDPLLKISAAQEQRIQRIQDDIMTKVKERREKVQTFESQSDHIMGRFQQFFDRRMKTEETIKMLEKAKLEMKEELNSLIRQAKSFDLTAKGADISGHVKELELKFKDFDKKKESFTQKLEGLKNIIMSKDAPVEKVAKQTPANVVKSSKEQKVVSKKSVIKKVSSKKSVSKSASVKKSVAKKHKK